MNYHSILNGGNVHLYGNLTEINGLIQKVFCLPHNRKCEYNNENKCIMSSYRNIHEIYFADNFKIKSFSDIVNHFIDIYTNLYSKTCIYTIILYNVPNKIVLNLFKQMFEKTCFSFHFIVTSKFEISYLKSFLLSLHIKSEHEEYSTHLLRSQVVQIFYLLKSDRTLYDIREHMYNILNNFYNIHLIIVCMTEEAMKLWPNDKHFTISHAAKVDHLVTNGNKEIIYLENFLLALINNERK